MSQEKELLLKIKTAPEKPGVYLFKNELLEVIYVGKAKNLKKRVVTYFGKGSLKKKEEIIQKETIDVEFIPTKTETEALILENGLIKVHKPKLNVRFKDDKTYPFLKITTSEELPRVEIVRKRISETKDTYFGPFTSTKSLKLALKQALSLFPIASCKSKIIVGKRDRSCLFHHINRCTAPCIEPIEIEEYNKLVLQFIKLFEGKHKELIGELKKEMIKASKELNYELAAKYRDKIAALEETIQKQRVVSKDTDAEYDIIGLATNESLAMISILEMRRGRITAQKLFPVELPINICDKEIITRFVEQYYSQAEFIPKNIFTEQKLIDEKIVNKWLKEKKSASKKPEEIIQRGFTQEHKDLLSLAKDNAELKLRTKEKMLKVKQKRTEKGLEKLKEILDLETIPRRIEGFDISTLQGTNTVASCVVFQDGKSSKKDYRRFQIRNVNQQDDFAAMYEVILRRFTGTLAEKEPRPNLVVVDGGAGQVSAAKNALKKAKIAIPLIGLAKEFEEIHFPDKREPLVLQERSEALKILQQIRDEAHRFAVDYHRKKRSKKMLHSTLSDIPGLGEQKINSLLGKFKTIKKIKNSSKEEITKVKGISEKLAQKILECLREEKI